MAKVRYSQLAKQDLEQVGDYIMDILKNPIAALNTVNRIQDAVDKLKNSPKIGAPLSARYENVNNYRFLVCGSYLVCFIAYKLMKYVDRILHGKRDYLKILFGGLPEEEIS